MKQEKLWPVQIVGVVIFVVVVAILLIILSKQIKSQGKSSQAKPWQTIKTPTITRVFMTLNSPFKKRAKKKNQKKHKTRQEKTIILNYTNVWIYLKR